MGMTVLCDGCGCDTQFLDPFVLRAATLEAGIIQADLCPTCAAPFWALSIGQKLIAEATAAQTVEKERRVAVIEAQAIAAGTKPPKVV